MRRAAARVAKVHIAKQKAVFAASVVFVPSVLELSPPDFLVLPVGGDSGKVPLPIHASHPKLLVVKAEVHHHVGDLLLDVGDAVLQAVPHDRTDSHQMTARQMPSVCCVAGVVPGGDHLSVRLADDQDVGHQLVKEELHLLNG